MVSKPVLRLAGDPDDIKGEEGEASFTRLEVATAVTLCVGIIQVGWHSVQMAALFWKLHMPF